MLTCAAVVRGPVRATTVTCPFTGILVPSHGVGETRGKVFKLDLKIKKKETKRYQILTLRRKLPGLDDFVAFL